MIRDLQQIASQHPAYPPIMFFYQGSVEEGEVFFRKLWPEARAVSDPEREFYNVFGIQRGGMKEMFGPEVWACGARAAQKGHFIGKPVGDPWVMPGLFLAHGERILWQHEFRHAGDHPDFLKIADSIPMLLQAQD
jgi:hypothetical protein